MEGLTMKKMFFSSKGNGNGVNTTNRCMGCTKDCESCFFKDVAGQFNKAAEEGGPVMSEQQKDVDQQHELNEGESVFPDLDNLTPEELETMKKVFYKMFDADEEDEEKEEEKEKTPILCKPYLVTIEAIYHEYYGRTDNIILRLATDAMGNVIKEPWSPHGANPDGRLDSLVFGVSLHHLTDMTGGIWVAAEDALELCTDHEGEYDSDTQEIIYPVGPNFMSKTIEINSNAMVALVRKMEPRQREKKWIMAVFEVMERNLLNDTEYFIGLPTFDIPDQEI
jgi:hypothetical protein